MSDEHLEDRHINIVDEYGRSILTVGKLKELLKDVSDDRHVVVDDSDDWWDNIDSIVLPGDWVISEYCAVTLHRGESVDTRQW